MDAEFDIDNLMKASMRNWWPVVKDLGIPKPKTVLLPLEKDEVSELIYMNKKPVSRELCDKIYMAARKIGYPHFLRTDQTSCKHNWEETCYVKDEDELFTRIYRLIEESGCLGIIGLPVYGFAFREFIPMDTKFKAFTGMPVNPERRYFAEGGKILCHHHYWIQDAITFYGRETPENWEKMLAEMNEETEEEIKHLSPYAITISKYLTKGLGGAWSIDFCKGKDGTWYFIDCAPMELSWHPDCDKKVIP